MKRALFNTITFPFDRKMKHCFMIFDLARKQKAPIYGAFQNLSTENETIYV